MINFLKKFWLFCKVKEVQIARIEPSDLIVLRCPKEAFTTDEANELKQRMVAQGLFNPIILLDRGASIEVRRMKQGPTGPTGYIPLSKDHLSPDELAQLRRLWNKDPLDG